MAQEAEHVDLWKTSIQTEIDNLKESDKKNKDDIRRLQDKQLLQDQDIQGIKSTLSEIKEDTKWLKRTITNAIIMSVFTAVIGGVITIVIAVFKG